MFCQGLFCGLLLLCVAFLYSNGLAQNSAEGPTDTKAQKIYQYAVELSRRRQSALALDAFKKADKQDRGQCVPCQNEIIRLGSELQDWKSARRASDELAAHSKTPRDIALSHYQLGTLLMAEAMARKKPDLLAQAYEEINKALDAVPNFPNAVYAKGMILARQQQDDAARAQFEQYLKMKPGESPQRERAIRYRDRPELARARMAPYFSVTAMDGRQIALDDFQGKVVLIDFWATWCEPCRRALPHVRDLARKFQGQPLVILSVSLDSDENAWREFVAKNEMSWIQYRDGRFDGPIAQLFSVRAIPQTFTIDANGVLQDQHIGDAEIESKLKKLVAEASDLRSEAGQGRHPN